MSVSLTHVLRLAIAAAVLLGCEQHATAPDAVDAKGIVPAAPERSSPGPGPGRAELLEQRTALRMWKLTVDLALDPTTARRLFPVFLQFEGRRRDLRREARSLRARLERESRTSDAREDVLVHLVRAIQSNRRDRRALDLERFDAIRGFLTPAQQASFLLLSSRGRGDRRRGEASPSSRR